MRETDVGLEEIWPTFFLIFTFHPGLHTKLIIYPPKPFSSPKDKILMSVTMLTKHWSLPDWILHMSIYLQYLLPLAGAKSSWRRVKKGESFHFTLHACYLAVGGSQRALREPTQIQEEHDNSTLKGSDLDSNLQPLICLYWQHLKHLGWPFIHVKGKSCNHNESSYGNTIANREQ